MRRRWLLVIVVAAFAAAPVYPLLAQDDGFAGRSHLPPVAPPPPPRQSGPIQSGRPPTPAAEVDSVVFGPNSYYCLISGARYCPYDPPGLEGYPCRCGGERGRMQ